MRYWLPDVGSYTAAVNVFALICAPRSIYPPRACARWHPAKAALAFVDGGETRRGGGAMPAGARTPPCLWNAATVELSLRWSARQKSPTCPAVCRWRICVPGLRQVSRRPPKGQSWHGADRQVRGAVMAVLH